MVVRTAWLCDDIYITFRTVENFVNGHGLRWNIAERVQAYTHPLWMLLISGAYFVTRDLYYSTIGLSLACSAAVLPVLARRLGTANSAVLVGLGVLLFSKAFVEYSASGLENPLTHLLLVFFFVVYFRTPFGRREFLLLALLGALIALNRMDAILLVLPALIEAFWRVRSARAVLAGLVGFSPFMLWEAFSVVYYGFPFPNTAYAKLGTGIGQLELLGQSYYYFLNSLRLDPVTLPAIAAALLLALFVPERKHTVVMAGVAFYLVYIARIGGDFMSGRFFAAPLLCSVIVLMRAPVPPPVAVMAAAGVAIMGLAGPLSPIRSGPDYGEAAVLKMDAHGIADERQYYYPALGLGSPQLDPKQPAHRFVREGMQIRARGSVVAEHSSIGMRGYFAGPYPYIVDHLGLADPLLARLPARYDPNWRIGHFRRVVPRDYARAVKVGPEALEDKELGVYYERLQRITRDSIWSRDRWRAIINMNLGRYDYLINHDRYRYPRGKPLPEF